MTVLCLGKGRSGLRRSLQNRIRKTNCGIFLTIAFTFCRGLWPLSQLLRGPLPARNDVAFSSGWFTANLAGKCPLYARAIVIVESLSLWIFYLFRSKSGYYISCCPLFNSRTAACGHSLRVL